MKLCKKVSQNDTLKIFITGSEMLDVGIHLEALGELISKKGEGYNSISTQKENITHTYDVCIVAFCNCNTDR